MHIVHIYKDYYPVLGGIEGHLRLLAEGLAARGHQITVLVASRNRQTTTDQVNPNLTIIRAARLLHAASTPLSTAMISIARTLRPDVVHLQFPYPPGDVAALAVPGRPPLVVSYQSDIIRQKNLLRVYRPLQALTLRRAAAIVTASPAYIRTSPVLQPFVYKCDVVPLGIDVGRFASKDQRPKRALSVAEGTKDQSERINSERVIEPNASAALDYGPQPVMNNAINASSPLPPRPSAPLPTLLFVGRLRYYKGLHILLDALALLGPHAPQLWLAGTGPEEARLRAQVARLQLDTRVRFLGDVPDADLPALYQRADIFVLPAHLRAEAYGLVLVEALASGLPAISTALGTGTDFINLHGQTGLVVPPNNPAALADAIVTLSQDPNLRARYGAAGQARAQREFDVTTMLDRMERVYERVVGGRR